MHLPLPVPGFRPTQVYLSDYPQKDTAVIFVHGFNGHAIDTWRSFQRLIDSGEEQHSWWQRCDVYFYGYQSVLADLTVLMARLTNFIRRVFPAPAIPSLFAAPQLALLPDQLARLCRSSPAQGFGPNPYFVETPDFDRHAPPSKYNHLVLVGHSQGGVLIRHALSEAVRDLKAMNIPITSQELEETFEAYRFLTARLRLFAPATSGFRPISFLGLLYNSVLALPVLAQFIKPVLKSSPQHEDLSFGSHRLTELRRTTERFASEFPWMESLKGYLVFGEAENVVYLDRFDCDPSLVIVPSKDHSSICKPNPRYLYPLEFIEHGNPPQVKEAGA